MRRIYRPSVETIAETVRRLAGETTEEKELYFMATNIIGQCVFYYSNRKMLELVLPEEGKGILGVDSLSRKIADFSISAICGLNKQDECRPNP